MGKSSSVSDAGPFIHLDEVDKLSILSTFKNVKTTGEVIAECHKIQAKIERLQNVEVSTIDSAGKNLAKYLINRYEIDLGEASALALCKQERVKLFLTDDLEARNVAQLLGFEPHGTIGIVTRAFREGFLSKKECLIILEALYMQSSLYLTKDLFDFVVKEIHRYQK